MKPCDKERPLVPLSACLAASAVLIWGLAWITERACEPGDSPSPEHAAMHYYRGEFYRLSGQPEKALPSFQRAVDCRPSSFSAHAGLGNALSLLGRFEEAEKCYRKALEIEANDAESLTNLGNLLLGRGRVAEACELYRRVLVREPNEVAVLNNLAWILATSLEAKERNGTEAVTLAERACAQSKQPNPILWRTLGAAYAEAGRFEDAVAAAEKGMRSAQEAQQSDLATEFQQQIQVYRSRKAVRYRP